MESAATFRNDGAEPTVLVQAAIGPGIRTHTLPPGVAIEEMGGGEVGALPADSALVTLSSQDLGIDDGRHFDTGRGGLALVVVEEGTLAVSGSAREVVLTRENHAAQASPAAASRGQPPAPIQLRDVRLLPDGRVGAIVEWGSADDPFRVDVSLFVVYEQVDGQWLIDETRPFIPNSSSVSRSPRASANEVAVPAEVRTPITERKRARQRLIAISAAVFVSMLCITTMHTRTSATMGSTGTAAISSR